MYIDYSFAKVITILGLSKIKAEKKDMIALLYPHLFVPLQPQICRSAEPSLLCKRWGLRDNNGNVCVSFFVIMTTYLFEI